PRPRLFPCTTLFRSCDTDLSALVGFHTEQGADLTVGVRRHFMDCPFGVVECSGLEIRRITEKPRLPFLVNAGIYVLGATAASAVDRKSTRLNSSHVK